MIRTIALLVFLLNSVSSSFASTQALVDTSSLWVDPRVEICFASSQTVISKKSQLFTDVKRAKVIYDDSPFEERIQTLLEREYNYERTGMSFRGFGNCDRVPADEPNAPAFIYADTELRDFGVTSVGDESRMLPPADRRGLLSGSVLNLRMVKTNRDYSVARAAKAMKRVVADEDLAFRIDLAMADLDEEIVVQLQDVTILHEMAHLAGLLHEERRLDVTAGQPFWCRSADDRRSQDVETEKTYGTEFDPFSITNYCADDIVKGFAFYHLLCQFPRVSEELSARNRKFDWGVMRPYCEFMMSRSYAARLSPRDRASLKRAYLGIPVPPGYRTYRTNPEEVHVIDALDALYDALPDSMELDPLAASAALPEIR